MQFVLKLLSGESGQDIVEYSLLIAFIACLTAALAMMNSAAVTGIWTGITGYLARAEELIS